MPPVPRVFLSSSCEDLKAYRASAEAGAQSARFLTIQQEYFVARDSPPFAECMERVAQADVLVVIVAHRYGWVPPDQPAPGEKSITWLECEQAAVLGRAVLTFVLEDGVDWPAERCPAQGVQTVAEQPCHPVHVSQRR